MTDFDIIAAHKGDAFVAKVRDALVRSLFITHVSECVRLGAWILNQRHSGHEHASVPNRLLFNFFLLSHEAAIRAKVANPPQMGRPLVLLETWTPALFVSRGNAYFSTLNVILRTMKTLNESCLRLSVSAFTAHTPRLDVSQRYRDTAGQLWSLMT